MDFKLDEFGFSWAAETILPSWKGYLGGGIPSGSSGVNEVSDGSVKVVFAPEGRDARPLAEDEIALVDWFLEHEHSVFIAAQAVIFENYSKIRESYGYSIAEQAKYMPDISSADELKQLIGINSVNIHQIVKGGLPYIGLDCRCTWDHEHGVGVLLHGTRPVEVGGSDTACLLWIAKRDAELN